MFGLQWLPGLDEAYAYMMLLTFLYLHIPVLDKKDYIKKSYIQWTEQNGLGAV